jgi:hypothetical protein
MFVQQAWAISLTVLLVCFVALFLVFLILYVQRPQPTVPVQQLSAKDIHPLFEDGQKAVVLYAYNESDETRKQNLQSFIDHGVILNTSLIDYYIIVNGETVIEFPKAANLFILKRQNQGWDFGAWGFGLEHLDQIGLYSSYNMFGFVNSSCRGPFTIGKNTSHQWLRMFGSKLSHKVGIVGASINCEIAPHVQTYAFVMTKQAMDLAKMNGIFKPVTEDNIWDLIKNREIGLSRALLRNNLTMACMMKGFENVDWFTTQKCDVPAHICPTNPNPTENVGLDPYEFVFVKCKEGHALWKKVTQETTFEK